MGGAYAAALFAAIALVVSGAAVAAPRICVIVPHFKDEYWLSVGYGLEQAAEAQDAVLMIHESGGYHALDRQIALLETCQASRADAILIGAVSADDPALLARVAEVAETRPVLALVNALHSQALAGWIGVDWEEMGAATGRFLVDQSGEGGPRRTVVITGPDESGWGPILDAGLSAAITGSSVDILGTYRADTGFREQLRELERALNDHPEVEVIVGSAPAIEGAMALLRRWPEGRTKPKLVATYISHSVLRGLRNGQVAMVPYDDPMAQGALGVTLALQAIAGQRFPGLSGPAIRSVTPESDLTEVTLSPSGYFPKIE